MSDACRTCAFLLLEDHGYSNYTVEGTDASCLHDANPGLPVDYFYGDAEALKFTCSRHKTGAQIRLDVDGEDAVEGDPEAVSLYRQQNPECRRP